METQVKATSILDLLQDDNTGAIVATSAISPTETPLQRAASVMRAMATLTSEGKEFYQQVTEMVQNAPMCRAEGMTQFVREGRKRLEEMRAALDTLEGK